PDDLDLAEVYDLSTALELDWYENIGLCGPGEAEKLVQDGATTIGGRIPANPSGGLACFGEAVPAQALAQVCEVAWQLRGAAGVRPARPQPPGVADHRGGVLPRRRAAARHAERDLPARADLVRARHRRAARSHPAEDGVGRGDVVPRLVGAERRQRPRRDQVACSTRRGARRPA